MTMAMEAFDTCRKLFGQLLRKHTEAAARCTGIVEFRLYLAVFRVDTKTKRDRMFYETLGDGQHTLVLQKGVEGDMSAAMQNLGELLFFVSRTTSMCKGTEFL